MQLGWISLVELCGETVRVVALHEDFAALLERYVTGIILRHNGAVDQRPSLNCSLRTHATHRPMHRSGRRSASAARTAAHTRVFPNELKANEERTEVEMCKTRARGVVLSGARGQSERTERADEIWEDRSGAKLRTIKRTNKILLFGSCRQIRDLCQRRRSALTE